MLAEKKVTVEVLKSGLWAQEPWLPQIEAKKGDVFKISISLAQKFEDKGKCKIIKEENPQKKKYVKKTKAEGEAKLMKSTR